MKNKEEIYRELVLLKAITESSLRLVNELIEDLSNDLSENNKIRKSGTLKVLRMDSVVIGDEFNMFYKGISYHAKYTKYGWVSDSLNSNILPFRSLQKLTDYLLGSKVGNANRMWKPLKLS